MNNGEILAVESFDQRAGYRRTATINGTQRGKIYLFFIQRVQQSNPDRWYTSRNGDTLIRHEMRNPNRIEEAARKDEFCTHHDSGMCKAPGICVEHGDNR